MKSTMKKSIFGALITLVAAIAYVPTASADGAPVCSHNNGFGGDGLDFVQECQEIRENGEDKAILQPAYHQREDEDSFWKDRLPSGSVAEGTGAIILTNGTDEAETFRVRDVESGEVVGEVAVDANRREYFNILNSNGGQYESGNLVFEVKDENAEGDWTRTLLDESGEPVTDDEGNPIKIGGQGNNLNDNRYLSHEDRGDDIDENTDRSEANEARSQQNRSDIDSNDTDIANNRDDIDSNDNDITNLQENNDEQDGRLDTNEGNIADNRSDIDSNSGQLYQLTGQTGPGDGEGEGEGGSVYTNDSALGQMDQRINDNDAEIGANTIRLDRHEQRLDRVEDEVGTNRRGVALAIATASHQFEVGENAPFQMSLSGGYFQGEEAMSIGFGGQASRNLFLNGNVGYTNGGKERSVGVSATWAFR